MLRVPCWACLLDVHTLACRALPARAGSCFTRCTFQAKRDGCPLPPCSYAYRMSKAALNSSERLHSSMCCWRCEAVGM